MEELRIRRFRVEDTEAIAELFTDTVHTVNAKDYSAVQLSAWAPRTPVLKSWRERLEGQAISFVAVRADQIVGFAIVTPDGHLDLLYTRADFVRQGIATALLQHVEDEARSRDVDHLFAEVSITARPFFDHAGFRLITSQTVERQGVTLLNYRMEKPL